MQEAGELIALVAHSRAEVVGSVAFDMVVLDMVEVVAIPRMAHQWVGNVWEEIVEPGEVLLEDSAHMDVLMHHQGIGTHVEPLPHRMQQPVPPVEIIE